MDKLLQILQLLAMIEPTVKAVEQVLPMSNQSKAKCDMAMQILDAAGVSVTTMAPLVQSLIGIVVKGYNDTGVFIKSAPVSAAVAAPTP